MKIKLHMWNIKCNYKRNESDTACYLCRKEKSTTEHVMVCHERHNAYNIFNKNENDWEK